MAAAARTSTENRARTNGAAAWCAIDVAGAVVLICLAVLVILQGGYYGDVACACALAAVVAYVIAVAVLHAGSRRRTSKASGAENARVLKRMPAGVAEHRAAGVRFAPHAVPTLLACVGAAELLGAFWNGASCTSVLAACSWFAVAGIVWIASSIAPGAAAAARCLLTWFGIACAVLGVVMYAGLVPIEGLVNAGRLQFTFQYANAAGIWFAACAVLCASSSSVGQRACAFLPVLALLLTQSAGAAICFALAVIALVVVQLLGDARDARRNAGDTPREGDGARQPDCAGKRSKRKKKGGSPVSPAARDTSWAQGDGIRADCGAWRAAGLLVQIIIAVIAFAVSAVAASWIVLPAAVGGGLLSYAVYRKRAEAVCIAPARVALAVGAAALLASCAAAIIVASDRLAQAGQTLIERAIQCLDGLGLLAGSPVVGVGPDAWGILYPFIQTAQYRAANIHCSYLQIALDGGIVALALFFAAVAVAFAQTARVVRTPKAAGGAGAGNGVGATGARAHVEDAAGLVVAAAVLFLHPLVDFDFEFAVLAALPFALLALARALVRAAAGAESGTGCAQGSARDCAVSADVASASDRSWQYAAKSCPPSPAVIAAAGAFAAVVCAACVCGLWMQRTLDGLADTATAATAETASGSATAARAAAGGAAAAVLDDDPFAARDAQAQVYALKAWYGAGMWERIDDFVASAGVHALGTAVAEEADPELLNAVAEEADAAATVVAQGAPRLTANQALVIASAYYAQERTDEAERLLIRSLAQQPYNTELYSTVADVFAVRGLSDGNAVAYEDAKTEANRLARTGRAAWLDNQVDAG